jgi:hypothetical protein
MKIMKVTLLLNDCNKKQSFIFESVMMIRINFKPFKGNHLTT